jgi:tetratricopeptide (TPR) repeat protein
MSWKHRTASRRRKALIAAGAVVLGLGCLGWQTAAYYKSMRKQWLSSTGVINLGAYLKAHPDDWEARHWYAYRSYILGKNDIAREQMKLLAEHEPRSSKVWYGLAVVSAVTGRTTESHDALSKVLELEPNLGVARSNLAQMLAEAGLVTDALHQFEIAEKTDKLSEAATASKARCLYTLGRKEEAWKVLVDSLTAMPMQDDPFVMLGRLAEELNRRPAAEPMLWRRVMGMAVYPNGVARAPLGRLMARWPNGPKDMVKAEELARRAVQDPVPQAEYFGALGFVLLQKGDLPGAEGALRKGLAKDPTHQECLRLMAIVAERQGRRAEAAEVRSRLRLAMKDDPRFRARWQKAESSGSPADYLALAETLRGLGRPSDAVEVCLRGLEKQPGDPTLTAAADEGRKEAIAKMPRRAVRALKDVQYLPWADK